MAILLNEKKAHSVTKRAITEYAVLGWFWLNIFVLHHCVPSLVIIISLHSNMWLFFLIYCMNQPYIWHRCTSCCMTPLSLFFAPVHETPYLFPSMDLFTSQTVIYLELKHLLADWSKHSDHGKKIYFSLALLYFPIQIYNGFFSSLFVLIYLLLMPFTIQMTVSHFGNPSSEAFRGHDVGLCVALTLLDNNSSSSVGLHHIQLNSSQTAFSDQSSL